jgi:hypothetical protein
MTSVRVYNDAHTRKEYLMRYLALAAVLAAASLAFLRLSAPAAAQQPDPPTTGLIVVYMGEQNGSGMDGRAEIMPADGGAKTFVQVFINQVEPAGSYAAMLHLGCAGPVAADLAPVVAQSGVTSGRSVTTVDLPFSQVADGAHAVAVHRADGGVISCGQIPAQPPAPRQPEGLPPTGSGPDAGGRPVTALVVLLMAGTVMAGAGAALRQSHWYKE